MIKACTVLCNERLLVWEGLFFRLRPCSSICFQRMLIILFPFAGTCRKGKENLKNNFFFFQVTLSTFADNFVLLHIRNDFEFLLEINFKTEFLMLLNRKLKESLNKELPRNFIDRFVSRNFHYTIKSNEFVFMNIRQSLANPRHSLLLCPNHLNILSYILSFHSLFTP